MLDSLASDIDDLVDGYGVVRLDEAINLRKVSQKKIVLMQGVYSEEDYLLAKKHDLDLVVHNEFQLNIIIKNNTRINENKCFSSIIFILLINLNM